MEAGNVTVVNYASQAALEAGMAASLKIVHNAGSIVLKAAPKIVKSAATLGSVLKSSINASLSLLNSAISGGSEFNKGVVEGVGEWGLDILKSGVSQLGFYYNLATKPRETINGIKSNLSNSLGSALNEVDKIANGDFSTINNGLNDFC